MSEERRDLRFTLGLRSNRKDWVGSLILALLFHLALIWLVLTAQRLAGTMSLDEGVGHGIGAGLAGGGGGGSAGEEIVTLVIPVADPTPPPPKPQVEITKPVVPPLKLDPVTIPNTIPPPTPPVDSLRLASADSARLAGLAAAAGGGGDGTGRGSGAGAGTGAGSGGGRGGGNGGGIGDGNGPGSGRGNMMPPSPDVLILPPQATSKVRGKTIVVQLTVDSTGVVRDVRLMPPTGDGKYDDSLRKAAFSWHFRPARNTENRPVTAVFEVTFTF